MHGHIAPAFRDDSLAEGFDAYLADNLDWSVDDFGGGYAWETAIPPRAEWEKEVDGLNAHLATL